MLFDKMFQRQLIVTSLLAGGIERECSLGEMARDSRKAYLLLASMSMIFSTDIYRSNLNLREWKR